MEVRDARCEDAAAIASILVEGVRATYAGMVPAALLAQLSEEAVLEDWRATLCGSPSRRERFTVVAVDATRGADYADDAAGANHADDAAGERDDGDDLAQTVEAGDLVAFASAALGAEDWPADSEYLALYMREGRQRQGLGRALTEALAARLADAGARSMMMWVAKENHRARRFHEANGGREVSSRVLHLEGGRVEEVGLLLDDVRRLGRARHVEAGRGA